MEQPPPRLAWGAFIAHRVLKRCPLTANLILSGNSIVSSNAFAKPVFATARSFGVSGGAFSSCSTRRAHSLLTLSKSMVCFCCTFFFSAFSMSLSLGRSFLFSPVA